MEIRREMRSQVFSTRRVAPLSVTRTGEHPCCTNALYGQCGNTTRHCSCQQCTNFTRLYEKLETIRGADKDGDTTENAVFGTLYLTAHPVNVTRTGSFLAALARMVCVWMACLVACAMIVLTTGLSAKYGDQVRIVQWRDSAVDF